MRNLVVGIDGSEASAAALAWAADTVGSDGRVHAVVGLNPWTERLVDAVTGDHISFRAVVEQDLVSRWTVDAREAVGELVTSVSDASMADALDHAATTDGAEAIVIGAHHSKLAALKRIGHATNRLIRRTVHPVIVVRPGSDSTRLDRGSVVVGIGHGNATRGAVRWAAHLARSRAVSIELVHALGDAPVFQASGVVDLLRHLRDSADEDGRRSGSVDHFAELLQTLTDDGTDVTVSTPPGLAALRLDEASEGAALLVVGRHRSMLDRGHHTAQPLRHALTHARCPVAVIADRPDDLTGGSD